jgi:hypothetical protein
MFTRDPAASMIVPGIYWVTYSKEYRELVDKARLEIQVRPMKWSDSAIIAEWGILGEHPVHGFNNSLNRFTKPGDCGWLILGDEFFLSAADITIIAGPLEAPYVHL